MRNKIVIAFITLNLLLVGFVAAQSTGSADLDEAQSLKEKIASKVAELEKKDQRAIAGVISKVNDTALTLVNNDEVSYSVKIDKDLTTIYVIEGGDQSEATVDDLSAKDYVIVSGPIENKTVTANAIYKDEQFFLGTGKITEINLTDFYIRAMTNAKETFTLDLETSTKRNMLNPKTLELEATTLAKIKEGDTIHFVYQISGDEREKNRYSATKILIIPQEYFIK